MEKKKYIHETEQIVIKICRREKHVVEYEEESQGVNKGIRKSMTKPKETENRLKSNEKQKNNKLVKEIVLEIIAKGYELNTIGGKRKQTSIYLSEEAICALDKTYVELAQCVKINKSDIIALLVKDFLNTYDGKNQEVLEIAFNYNAKCLKKKISNWTPSLEMREQLEIVIEKYGLNRLKMKYNMVCDMILLHYLK